MSDEETPPKASWETVIQNVTTDDNHAPTFISLFIVRVPATMTTLTQRKQHLRKSSHGWQELLAQVTVLNHKGSKILGLYFQASHQPSGELFSLYK